MHDHGATSDAGGSPIQDTCRELRERAAIYGFFSVLLARELDADTIKAFRACRFLAEMEALDPELADQFSTGDPRQTAEELACEFARLFIGPLPVVPPYQSCHENATERESRQLWTEATSEVYCYVRDLSLKFGEAYHGIPDHISLVLELMQKFLDEEAEALKNADLSKVATIRKVRSTFFENHVGPWGQRFFSKVERESMHPFYGSVARLANRFLAVEVERCSGKRLED